jgi:ABC-2 type transport system permease protein
MGETRLRLTALIRHNTMLLLREPGPLLSRLMMPLVFIVILRPLYQAAQGPAAGTRQAVAGSLVTFSLLALSIVGSAIMSERVWATWNRIHATAARPAEVLVGKALPVMGALLAQQILVLAFGILAFDLVITDPLPLVAVLLCWTLALLAMGAMLGVLVRSLSELALAHDIGGMVLSSLGGALAPLTSMPQWVQELAPVSPGYWAIRGLLSTMRGDPADVLPACGALLGFACVAAGCAALRVRRGWSRSVAM